MSSAQAVFDIPDIRELIFEKRKYACLERVRRVYPRWGKDGNGISFVNTMARGKTHRTDTKYVTWSILKGDNLVDESPIIVTDNVYYENGEMDYLDCLVNDVHLLIQSEPWYDKTNHNIANKVMLYKQRILEERKVKFLKEYKRRGF